MNFFAAKPVKITIELLNHCFETQTINHINE